MPACKCSERKKPANRRKWRILQYKCNHSAFNVFALPYGVENKSKLCGTIAPVFRGRTIRF